MKSKILSIFNETKKKSIRVGVVGYSDKKFDKGVALELLCDSFDEATKGYRDITIVSGLTDLGIPALAYKEALARKWGTVGIACKKASEFKCFDCDEIVMIGEEWGDESEKFLDSIDVLIRIGGGKQSIAEVKKAKEMGIKAIEHELEEIK